MFGMFKRTTVPTDLSKITIEHIKVIMKEEEPAEVGAILRRAAQAGSRDAAVMVSTLCISVRDKGNANQKVHDDFVFFTELAAKLGDEGSQWNIAKFYVSASQDADGQMNAEGYEKLKKAEFWYKKAAAQGFAPASKSLADMKPLFDWAHQAFGDQDELPVSEVQAFGHKCAHDVCTAIDDMAVIRQLVREDIEGASLGNETAKAFARSCGISREEYTGALSNSRPEVDGPEGAKTYLDSKALSFAPDMAKVAEFRLAATDYIMKYHSLGKYAKVVG